MTEKVPREKIKREKGFLYFIGKDGYIWAAPMKHNKTGVKHKVGTQKVPPYTEETWPHVFPSFEEAMEARKQGRNPFERYKQPAPAPEPTPKKLSFLEWLLGKK
jgi:hypothetical protein